MKRVIAFMLALLLLASLMTYNLTLNREEESEWHTIWIEVEDMDSYDDYDWNCSEWQNSTWNCNGDNINITWSWCWTTYETEP